MWLGMTMISPLDSRFDATPASEPAFGGLDDVRATA